MDYAKESLRLHYEWKGKLEMTSRAAVDSKEALSLAYTPGVAQPCLEIQKDVNKSYELTRRWNTVAVVTDNENYETGVGMGFLLVKMRLSGVQLTWNQELSSISAAEAEEFAFGATLSYDGDVSISQESVHYLYTGLTSSWRLYSSTTTPPTEPGSYVVTVVTLGGNYQAAPITRSFRITK